MSRSFWPSWRLVCASIVVATVVACSGRRLPPGTPPPEYEPPIVAPWTPEVSDAGAPKQGEPPPELTNPTDAGAGAELSLDAGPR